MTEIRTILHPTDFFESSEAACRLACAFARDYGARLVILHVYPPPLTGAEAVDRGRPDGIEEDLLTKLRDLVPDDRTITVEYRVVEGHPSEVILRTAAEEGCDLIVMGTHGRSGLGRALMGSVAEEVSRKAFCPVATVRSSIPILP
ncbi:MAG: putative universal stress protein [Gemmataceae bacterium]|nr:putative universal stress protein [Gemmataceae bacterium]